MENNIFAAFHFNGEWLHHPPARSFSIAGVHIHMPAPETARTVIRKAASPHKKTALFAGKVLFYSLEILNHYFLSTPQEHAK